MDIYKVKLTFTEKCLGTAPADPETYTKFIESKAPEHEDQEVETLPEVDSGPITVFHRQNGNPAVYDYLIRGFFKECCSALRRVEGMRSKKLTAFKKIIDGLVFVSPRLIEINVNGGEIGFFERPLRAQTPKGERIALTKSESVPIGSSLEFELKVLGVVKEPLLKEWLDYGELKGLGQFRSGGYGTFTYEMEKIQ